MKLASYGALCAFFLLALASPAPLVPPHAAGVPWTAPEIAALDRAIDAALRDPALRGAHVGLVALDTERGTRLIARDADDEFVPASNFKLLVGSAALARLGTSFAFITTVAADARPVNGTISGNVYLRGGGDALLTGADLRAAAAALAAAGVRRITGSVVTDATYFDGERYGSGWQVDDLPYGYAPVVSALELDDGTAHMTFAPGPQVGAPAIVRVRPQTSAFEVRNDLRTGAADSDDTSRLVRPWNAPDTIEVAGSYPLDAPLSGDVGPSVPDPARFAGDVFARALAAAGIRVDGALQNGRTPPQAIVLWAHRSDAMPQLLADFWYPSDNLIGELLLKQLGVVQGGVPGTAANGRALEEAFLRRIGIDPATLDIADGSGLSPYDRITPDDLVAILQYDWASADRAIVLQDLPVAGVRGTLQESFANTPLAGIVFAKTGSLRHVRTLSGYVQNAIHGPVTFSLLVNDWMGDQQPGGSQALARVRAAILGALASVNLGPVSPSPSPSPSGPIYAGNPAVRFTLVTHPLGVDPDGNARWLVETRFFDARGMPTRILENSDFHWASPGNYVQWQTRMRYGMPAAIVSTTRDGPLAITVRAKEPAIGTVVARTDTRVWKGPRVVARALGPRLVQIGWFPRAQRTVRIVRIDARGTHVVVATLHGVSSTYRDTTVHPDARYRYVVARRGYGTVRLAAVTTPPAAPRTPLAGASGIGMWLFFTNDPRDDIYVGRLDPQAIVAQAVRAHLHYVELRTAYGAYWEITPRAKPIVDAIIDGLAAHGIGTIGWTVPRDRSFEDVRQSVRTALYHTAAGTPLAGVAIDLERGDAFMGEAPEGTIALARYLREVREALGPAYLLVATVEDPYLEHLRPSDYPYAAIARQASVLQPMSYWRMMRRNPTTPAVVRTLLRASYAKLRAYARRTVPISLGGQTVAAGPNGAPPAGEIAASLDEARALHALGVCYFDWDGTDTAQWEALATHRW